MHLHTAEKVLHYIEIVLGRISKVVTSSVSAKFSNLDVGAETILTLQSLIIELANKRRDDLALQWVKLYCKLSFTLVTIKTSAVSQLSKLSIQLASRLYQIHVCKLAGGFPLAQAELTSNFFPADSPNKPPLLSSSKD